MHSPRRLQRALEVAGDDREAATRCLRQLDERDASALSLCSARGREPVLCDSHARLTRDDALHVGLALPVPQRDIAVVVKRRAVHHAGTEG